MATPLRIPLKGATNISYVEAVKSTGIIMECPCRLALKKGGKFWTLPLEPTISIKASKTVVRRNIAKATGSGTVKEVFSLDDYEISIEGLLQGADDNFPEADFSKLQSFLQPLQNIVIQSRLTDLVGIDLICVVDWEYPATPGLENQAYQFTAYSDQYFDLT